MPPPALRVGLIGYGYAARTFHAPLIAGVPGLELAAVSSRDAARVHADWPAVEVLADAHSLIARADLDLVVIASPNDSHHPLAHAALMAGRNVVVDKPFTLTLAQARERSRGLHRALKAQVETYLGDPEFERHLRDRYFTIRNERYVLPIVVASRSAVPGIVHNASQSGQTLFVEPEGMVELGNELAIAAAMAAEEEARILRELSGAVAARAAALAAALDVLAALDLLEGSARLASDLDAHPPEVGAERDGFELLSLRHPLLTLQGKKVVASHVRLAPPARALIVSGPNGGGKTVAISAVGLAALMLRAGLPVAAAEGSRLPFFLEVKAARISGHPSGAGARSELMRARPYSGLGPARHPLDRSGAGPAHTPRPPPWRGAGGPMGKTALVLGGGFGGLEAAIQLRKRGFEVTLVSDRPALFIYPTSIWIATCLLYTSPSPRD